MALYMHDSKNQLSVQNLIVTLAGTFSTMYQKDTESQDGSPEFEFPWLMTYHAAFWETISREWSGIDQWRMNKYLLLIRMVVREVLQLLFATEQREIAASESLLKTQIQVLRALPLSPRERAVPDGLRLHVLDIWSDEIETAKSTSKSTSTSTSKSKFKSGSGPGRENVDEDKSSSPYNAGEKSGEDRERQLKRTEAALMEIISTLAKESLSKSVKTKAKELVKMYETSISGPEVKAG
jgi:ribosomal RNA-processing protein 1